MAFLLGRFLKRPWSIFNSAKEGNSIKGIPPQINHPYCYKLALPPKQEGVGSRRLSGWLRLWQALCPTPWRTRFRNGALYRNIRATLQGIAVHTHMDGCPWLLLHLATSLAHWRYPDNITTLHAACGGRLVDRLTSSCLVAQPRAGVLLFFLTECENTDGLWLPKSCPRSGFFRGFGHGWSSWLFGGGLGLGWG